MLVPLKVVVVLVVLVIVIPTLELRDLSFLSAMAEEAHLEVQFYLFIWSHKKKFFFWGLFLDCVIEIIGCVI